MHRDQQIAEHMTTKVITVGPHDTMDKVEHLFETYLIHHVPVVENGQLIGIVSKSDYNQILHGMTLFKSAHSSEYNKAILRSLLAKEVMTEKLVTLKPDDTIGTAADYFRENRFHCIPIVDEAQKVKGILTTYDLITV